MAVDERLRLGKADRADRELPIQHRVAIVAIADPAQPVAGDLLRAKTAQQLASPGGIVVHAVCNAVQKARTTRVENEIPTNPYIAYVQHLGFAAEPADRLRPIGTVVMLHDAPPHRSTTCPPPGAGCGR